MTIAIMGLHYRSWWRGLLHKCRLPIAPTRLVEVNLPFVCGQDFTKMTLEAPRFKLKGQVDLLTGAITLKSENKAFAGYVVESSNINAIPQ